MRWFIPTMNPHSSCLMGTDWEWGLRRAQIRTVIEARLIIISSDIILVHAERCLILRAPQWTQIHGQTIQRSLNYCHDDEHVIPQIVIAFRSGSLIAVTVVWGLIFWWYIITGGVCKGGGANKRKGKEIKKRRRKRSKSWSNKHNARSHY